MCMFLFEKENRQILKYMCNGYIKQKGKKENKERKINN